MSEQYLHRDPELFYVIRKLCDVKKSFTEKDLSDVIKELGDKSFVLTDIKDGLPYLKYILTDYLMYNIITGSDPYYLTGEGVHYTGEKIKQLTTDFTSVADNVMSKYKPK